MIRMTYLVMERLVVGWRSAQAHSPCPLSALLVHEEHECVIGLPTAMCRLEAAAFAISRLDAALSSHSLLSAWTFWSQLDTARRHAETDGRRVDLYRLAASCTACLRRCATGSSGLCYQPARRRALQSFADVGLDVPGASSTRRVVMPRRMAAGSISIGSPLPVRPAAQGRLHPVHGRAGRRHHRARLHGRASLLDSPT